MSRSPRSLPRLDPIALISLILLARWPAAAQPAPEGGGVPPAAPSEPAAPAEPAPAPAAEPDRAAPEPTASEPAPAPTSPGAEEAPTSERSPERPAAEAPEPGVAAPAPSVDLAAPDSELESFGATAIAPVPAARIDLGKVPRNVQQLNAADLTEDHPLSLHEALNSRLGSATVNDVQNNPLQPDLQYRGFTASPLLGTPQGIAVYQNGVRINEAFGDVLQWDMVPSFAIADVDLIPGANPIYGLNALGGSLVLRMKNGFRNPGLRLEGLAGSFGRYQTSAGYGRALGDWAVYAGASAFGEQGYRDKSPSSAQNVFADVRNRSASREVGLSLTLGRSNLFGNGPAPVELLREDRRALYTWPDITRNNLLMVSGDVRQQLGARTSLLGSAYFRHTQRNTANGDAAEFALCDGADPSRLCDEAGSMLSDEAGRPILTDQAFDAVFNRTHTVSDSLGAALLLDVQERLFDRENHLALGTSYDGSRSGFVQSAEVGWLTPERGVLSAGSTLSDPSFHTDLGVQNHALGAYITETWTPLEPLSINVAARFNWFETALDDRQGSALDGRHHFARLNPALGVTYQFIPELGAFAGYSESNRAPSAAELSCADPDQPCRVPNAFISDPPLAQVVSRSVEVGLRGRVGPKPRPILTGSLAAFGTRNQNDILFVAGSRIGTGHFQNAGDTRRVGLEAALRGDIGPIRWYASYTWLRATFESELELPGGANPAASGVGGDDDDDEGEGPTLRVEKGSRIPGLPTHALKAGISVRPITALEIGLSVLGQSGQYLRGDEANALAPVRGYVVLNAHAGYQLLETLQLFVRAQNLLDNAYSTFGVVADPAEALPGTTVPRFLGRGAPFGLWAGLVLTEAP